MAKNKKPPTKGTLSQQADANDPARKQSIKSVKRLKGKGKNVK